MNRHEERSQKPSLTGNLRDQASKKWELSLSSPLALVSRVLSSLLLEMPLPAASQLLTPHPCTRQSYNPSFLMLLKDLGSSFSFSILAQDSQAASDLGWTQDHEVYKDR